MIKCTTLSGKEFEVSDDMEMFGMNVLWNAYVQAQKEHGRRNYYKKRIPLCQPFSMAKSQKKNRVHQKTLTLMMSRIGHNQLTARPELIRQKGINTMSKTQEKEIKHLTESYHLTGKVSFLLKASRLIRIIKGSKQ